MLSFKVPNYSFSGSLSLKMELLKARFLAPFEGRYQSINLSFREILIKRIFERYFPRFLINNIILKLIMVHILKNHLNCISAIFKMANELALALTCQKMNALPLALSGKGAALFSVILANNFLKSN